MADAGKQISQGVKGATGAAGLEAAYKRAKKILGISSGDDEEDEDEDEKKKKKPSGQQLTDISSY